VPPQNLDRTLHALTSAAESVDNTTAEQVENIQTTHQTEAANINRLGETLEQAVSSGDHELLVNLAAVAEQLNANRQRPITLSEADGPPADYETYIWHDATDGWCFRITELDIEERHHTDPESIPWAAASAAALVCGEPVDIRITVGPSTDGSAPHDRAAARSVGKKI
jgi:hypothetical protein